MKWSGMTRKTFKEPNGTYQMKIHIIFGMYSVNKLSIIMDSHVYVLIHTLANTLFFGSFRAWTQGYTLIGKTALPLKPLHQTCFVLGFVFFVPGLELRAYTLSHSTSPFYVKYFWDRVSQTICPGWLQAAILLISVSWVARIIGMSQILFIINILNYCPSGK
jgi:hypothetical protein